MDQDFYARVAKIRNRFIWEAWAIFVAGAIVAIYLCSDLPDHSFRAVALVGISFSAIVGLVSYFVFDDLRDRTVDKLRNTFMQD